MKLIGYMLVGLVSALYTASWFMVFSIDNIIVTRIGMAICFLGSIGIVVWIGDALAIHWGNIWGNIWE